MDTVTGTVKIPSEHTLFMTQDEAAIIESWLSQGVVSKVDDDTEYTIYHMTHPDFTLPDSGEYLLQLVTVEDNPNCTLSVHALLKITGDTVKTVKEYVSLGDIGILL